MGSNLSMTSQSQFSYLVDNRICRVSKRKLTQVVVIVIPSSRVSWCLCLPVPTLDPPSPMVSPGMFRHLCGSVGNSARRDKIASSLALTLHVCPCLLKARVVLLLEYWTICSNFIKDPQVVLGLTDFATNLGLRKRCWVETPLQA